MRGGDTRGGTAQVRDETSSALATETGLVHVVGAPPTAETDRLRAACAGADVPAALSAVLQDMQMGECAELRIGATADHGKLTARVDLKSWRKVEVVPKTDDAVVLTTLAENEDMYERPNAEAACEVSYKIFVDGKQVASSGEAPERITQGDEAVLRCIDVAVLEMKKGTRVRVGAPASWAYGAAGHVPPAGTALHKYKDSAVEVRTAARAARLCAAPPRSPPASLFKFTRTCGVSVELELLLLCRSLPAVVASLFKFSLIRWSSSCTTSSARRTRTT